ncbi:hypothetical protein RHMOL_Rhmol10G0156200 [Rhododendron molle]|uniref:Uncharacterized protein n=1 Tax=Rhododendron molle TaxID=49168 RepID=A0ACC0M3T5_RHOML|nr:hypothetical protein RHMOL_Rhmol10G0156200 [Rhododendron molle]
MRTGNEVPRHPRNRRLRGLKILEEETDPTHERSLLGVRRSVLMDALSSEPGTGLSQFARPPQLRDVSLVCRRKVVQVKKSDPTEREASEDNYVLQ